MLQLQESSFLVRCLIVVSRATTRISNDSGRKGFMDEAESGDMEAPCRSSTESTLRHSTQNVVHTSVKKRPSEGVDLPFIRSHEEALQSQSTAKDPDHLHVHYFPGRVKTALPFSSFLPITFIRSIEVKKNRCSVTERCNPWITDSPPDEAATCYPIILLGHRFSNPSMSGWASLMRIL